MVYIYFFDYCLPSMATKLSHKLDKTSICPRGMARFSGKVSTPTSKTPPFISLMPEILPPETTSDLNTDLSFSEFFLFFLFVLFCFPKWFFYLFFQLAKVAQLSYRKRKLKHILKMSYISFPTMAEILSVPQYLSLFLFLVAELGLYSGWQCVFLKKKTLPFSKLFCILV